MRFLDLLFTVWSTEPVIVVRIVEAIVAILIALGTPISADLKAALILLVMAVGTFVARANVTPWPPQSPPASKS